MAGEAGNQVLASQLLEAVRRFVKHKQSNWKSPAICLLEELRKENVHAVYFGGSLRSFLAPKLGYPGNGVPRDLDIVVSSEHEDKVRRLVADRVKRETRFGGLQVQQREWHFDLWSVSKTWAFTKDEALDRDFATLPATTFFNLEAIAVDVWPHERRTRQIYGGNGQFFDGLVRRVLDINREENPFPELCVVRAVVMAASLDFRLSARLASYIRTHARSMTVSDIKDIQRSHYERERMKSHELHRLIQYVRSMADSSSSDEISLPIERATRAKQLEFWPIEGGPQSITVHSMPRVPK